MKVCKYNINLHPQQYLWMPDGANVLDVQLQGDQLVLWATVCPSEKPKLYEFAVYGTGEHIDRPRGLKHISTVQKGGYVWHVFLRE
jgi:hypothetical protein